MQREQIHFITGRLAEASLRAVLKDLAPRVGFDYSIQVLNITVAALMTPKWVAPRIKVPEEATRVILPGYCLGDLTPVEQASHAPVERGPKDLRQLPEYFGQSRRTDDYGQFDIEILAEINHAPRMSLAEILAMAKKLAAEGADLIDVGCNPGETWAQVGEVVRALRDQGHRVSIDSLNPDEIAPAVKAGAELVLSVNASNREAAVDWGCEVVVLPETPKGMAGLAETVEFLAKHSVPMRLDPVLEPIGFGFAESITRYATVRQQYPDLEMLMGIGNLTELTDADSAAMNVMLLGICQELGIRSVLTTQVVNWARTSVRECDLARRLVYHAVQHQTLPKRVEPRLVTLRDARLLQHGDTALSELAQSIKDNNYRIYAEQDKLHLIGAALHLQSDDPFELFDQLADTQPANLDASHAFYLGYELAKATTALTLHKDYRQDEALDWGYLTRPEVSHRLKKREAQSSRSAPEKTVDQTESEGEST